MAKLKASRRKKLPKSAFAYPSTRKYPIHDKAHARNALARAAQKGTSGTYAHVAAAVRKKYGSSIAVGGKKRTTASRRKSSRRSSSRRK